MSDTGTGAFDGALPATACIARRFGDNAQGLRNIPETGSESGAQLPAGCRHAPALMRMDIKIRCATSQYENHVWAAGNRYGEPETFNINQDCQFTDLEFIELLKQNNIAISMDGKGC